MSATRQAGVRPKFRKDGQLRWRSPAGTQVADSGTNVYGCTRCPDCLSTARWATWRDHPQYRSYLLCEDCGRALPCVRVFAEGQRDAWRHVAAYYLGDFVDTHSPQESRDESIRRASDAGRAYAEWVRLLEAVISEMRNWGMPTNVKEALAALDAFDKEHGK